MGISASVFSCALRPPSGSQYTPSCAGLTSGEDTTGAMPSSAELALVSFRSSPPISARPACSFSRRALAIEPTIPLSLRLSAPPCR